MVQVLQLGAFLQPTQKDSLMIFLQYPIKRLNQHVMLVKSDTELLYPYLTGNEFLRTNY